MTQRLKNLWTKLKSDPSDLWSKSKFFVIVFGVIILLLKLKGLIANLLVLSGKNIFDRTQQETNDLSDKEDESNESADELINDANDLSKDEPKIPDDWNDKE